jgi:hypothetical protein
MAIKPARWVWVVTRPHGPSKKKGLQIAGAQCIDATDVSAAMDAISVTFFDLSGLVYALPGIHAACALTEVRELTAEEERILSTRPVHAEPNPGACNQHQGIMMLLAKDTGRTVAVSPASSHYGVIWEVD